MDFRGLASMCENAVSQILLDIIVKNITRNVRRALEGHEYATVNSNY